MVVPHLILGNARYSSWSMRPYLVLKRAGIEFTTEFLPLRTDEFRARMRDVSPFALVPTLQIGDEIIGDSLAISEWAAEKVPSLWPEDSLRRAQARMLAGQMHAGFMNIRRELPMNLGRDSEARETLEEGVLLDIEKLILGWRSALEKSGGPFLFGDWSIADAMYAPVATRFRTYDITLPWDAQAYCSTLLDQPEFLEWNKIAEGETWVIEDVEQNYN
jgi:glutathione S-transferase